MLDSSRLRLGRKRTPGLLLGLALLWLLAGCGGPPRIETSDLDLPNELSQSALERMAVVVAETLREPNGTLSSSSKATGLQEVKQPVYVVLRAEGRRVASAWSESGDWESNLRSAIQQAILSLPGYDAVSVDSCEICLTHSYQPFEWTGKASVELESLTGLEGLELRALGHQERFAPTTMLEKRWSFTSAFRDFFRGLGKDSKRLGDLEFESRRFQAYQVLVQRYPEARAEQMLRGKPLTPVSLSAQSLSEFRTGLQTWLVSRVDENGKVPARYTPGLDRNDDGRRAAVRQWLVTWALGRLASRDATVQEAYIRNLRFNLNRTYRTDGVKGYVSEGSRFPLGGLAIAGMALLEGAAPKDTRIIQESLSLGLPDFQTDLGHLQGFLDPSLEDRNQSYYPGEALLFWARLLADKPNQKGLELARKSFLYYRKVFQEDRDLESIPWLSLANYQMWLTTEDREYADFLFLLADTTAPNFAWDSSLAPDLWGQYQREDRFPSVNTTGAQMLGLATAYRTAVDLAETERAEVYRQAMLKGFYQLLRLQYTTQVDLFCARNPVRTKGGLRHSAFDLAMDSDSAVYPLLVLDILGDEGLGQDLTLKLP